MGDLQGPLAQMLHKLATHAVLSDDDRTALLALPFVRRSAEAGDYLVRAGTVPEQCAVLLSGFAFRSKLSFSGERQIVSIHIPGEILDLQHLFLNVTDHNVQTLTRAEIAIIPSRALRALVRAQPSIGHAIFINVLVEASIFREWILNIGRRDARARVAHLLCEFAMRLDKQGLPAGQSYELPMTQEQLGDALGLTSVHVNRTLKALEAAGLIERDHRHVSFPNWGRLRAEAGFDSTYLHLRQQAA